jgi:hypothetical protein
LTEANLLLDICVAISIVIIPLALLLVMIDPPQD